MKVRKLKWLEQASAFAYPLVAWLSSQWRYIHLGLELHVPFPATIQPEMHLASGLSLVHSSAPNHACNENRVSQNRNSAPLVRMTSSSRLLILNGSKLLNKSSSCEIAWEKLMVWKLETLHHTTNRNQLRPDKLLILCQTRQLSKVHGLNGIKKCQTRFIKAPTFQHLFVPHKTPKPIQTLRFCWGRKRNARPQPCVRIWSVEHANVEETKRMDLGIFHVFFLLLAWSDRFGSTLAGSTSCHLFRLWHWHERRFCGLYTIK